MTSFDSDGAILSQLLGSLVVAELRARFRQQGLSAAESAKSHGLILQWGSSVMVLAPELSESVERIGVTSGTERNRIMVKARLLSLAEQGKNSSITKLERKHRDEYRKCTAILQRHPLARAAVLSYLEDLEYTETSPIAPMVQSVQAVAQAQSKQSKKELAKVAKLEKEDKVNIPTKYNTLALIPPSVIEERVCPRLDGISLSYANVHCMFGKTARVEEKKGPLSQLIEFVTGEPPSLPLRGELRTWEALLARLKAGARDRQRSLRLELPIDYATAGVYKIEGFDVVKKHFTIAERFTGEKVEVKFQELQPIPSDPSVVVIDKNWSEAFAELVVPENRKGTGKPCRIGNRFEKHIVSKKRDASPEPATPLPSPGKRRRMEKSE
eukprot:6470403-Amphidinium_carterae.2